MAPCLATIYSVPFPIVWALMQKISKKGVLKKSSWVSHFSSSAPVNLEQGRVSPDPSFNHIHSSPVHHQQEMLMPRAIEPTEQAKRKKIIIKNDESSWQSAEGSV